MVGLAVLALPVGLVIALVWVGRLQRRVWELEQRVAQWQGVVAPAAAARAGAPAQAAPNAPVDDQQPVPSQVSMPTEAVAPVPRATAAVPPPLHSMDPSLAARSSASVFDAAASAPSPVAASAQPTQPPSAPSAPTPPPTPNAIERAASALKRWFTEGNVPVKVGMLVLLAGVASLLKYASDQGWMRMPVELRLAGISAVALAGLVFGWRQRTVRPGFALALQGGAIGGLLLTVFAAFKLYGLLGAGLAMGISVVLIAGMCVLAVLQDSRTLAVLGVLAGFLAPIWLSSGSGNHIALFSYYAVLNAGIVAVAWVRPWRC